MKETDLYRSYPDNESYIRDYIGYQQRYATRIRESDRVVLDIVAERIGVGSGGQPRLLDIGCSTGNLLRHLRRAFPQIALSGGDLSDLQVEACQKDPGLGGIAFRKMDIQALPESEYDLITANAILYGFDDAGFQDSIASIGRALKQGGSLIAFDYFHPWKQEISIIERSGSLPDGHPLHFRSYASTRKALEGGGFRDIDFRPFSIPIDLPKPDLGTDLMETYTVPTTDGQRLLFRGAIAQPWCHLVAIKG